MNLTSRIATDEWLTSANAFWSSTFARDEDMRLTAMFDVLSTFSSCRSPRGLEEDWLVSSATLKRLTANAVISSPNIPSCVVAGIGGVGFVGYGAEGMIVHQAQPHPDLGVTLDFGESAASDMWTTVRSHLSPNSFSAALDDLSEIVAEIRERAPMRLSSEVEDLIDKAAEAYGAPVDIDGWARRLVDDIHDCAD